MWIDWLTTTNAGVGYWAMGVLIYVVAGFQFEYCAD